MAHLDLGIDHQRLFFFLKPVGFEAVLFASVTSKAAVPIWLSPQRHKGTFGKTEWR
jgi:hypothetical protein